MRSGLSIAVFAALVLSVLSSCLFTVHESQRAMIVRLGRLETGAVNQEGKPQVEILKPGLHFKWPFIDTVLRFDTRLQMSELPSARIVTVEKKDLIVDLFVKWRIDNIPLFYTSTFGGGSQALDGRDRAIMLLNQKVVDALRAEFGRKTIRQVVSEDRANLMEILRKDTDKSVSGFGIHVVDVRIKRIDLPPEVSGAVFERMRSERKQFATEIRANGEAKGETIRAKADRERRVILANAKKAAERIRGEGDAFAVDVLAKAYGKSPEFFDFYRSMEAYKQAFKGDQDVFVLSPSSGFFKQFNSQK